ncbi:allantoin permease [Staphylococcus gallinarum]|uniref:Putative allantoin permease n=1 Tax=Staphylococcus gallinarum TaxID=1293 RepID=A0A3A0H5F1_STAGA|nr:putative allantoin permease [Staphylococcus gallinarum]MBU7216486.1 putative allantoin permease [Staphylococcus gallinarum]MCD8793655.1 putative allantoin permease [Staphylococcus gallinarum]MCD8826265.1 putative allantoin permease [Staphylococcus gallinarum]PTE38303.1 putative allantoin permease [Staphylococcus gallinarum]PTE79871.1 putative allantoin permease [Staphylococcus gallinarum]
MGTVGKATSHDQSFFEKRGYNKDIIPKTPAQRNNSAFNFFTLWMGAVHNIPNYTAVGGFLLIGLSPLQVIIALIFSSFFIALLLVANGYAGSKYGIPFSMQLRSTYGDVGAKLPGVLRGVIAGIAWFGLQTFAGSQALHILLNKIFPGFNDIGHGMTILGITIPALIAFLIFWAISFAIGFGGGEILNKFTAILNPLIYIVFGGMAIWGIIVSGGVSNILNYDISTKTDGILYPAILSFFLIFNSLLGVWAGPGSSVADFTQNAKSTKAQVIGQISGIVVAHILFAFASVFIIIGGSIYLGHQEWNILTIINEWSNFWAILIATGVLLMTTISTNATSNIIPAAYQLSALMPKIVNYRRGVIIACVASVLIMPWKMMENEGSIVVFLNAIGAFLGPVAGVMIVHFYLVTRCQINLEELYFDMFDKEINIQRINISAYIATIVGVVISLLGFLPAFKVISDFSWFIGFIISSVIYIILHYLLKVFSKEKEGVKYNEV